IGEILSPEEEEDSDEYNLEEEPENIINIEGLDTNGESDQESSNIQNSETESELSDYNLQDLFQENIINMGATRLEVETAVKRIMERAMGLGNGTLDNPLGAGEAIAERIENAGNEVGMIHLPIFSGKEEEDVSDWIRQFEVAFTATGKAAGVNGARQAAVAATCLRGSASQWYNEMKEAAAGNLVNWANNDNDNDLKHRITRKFTREDVSRKKMVELAGMRQGMNESIEEYTRRFRAVLRIATRGHALHDVYQ